MKPVFNVIATSIGLLTEIFIAKQLILTTASIIIVIAITLAQEPMIIVAELADNRVYLTLKTTTEGVLQG
jgi:hypothetical protein